FRVLCFLLTILLNLIGNIIAQFVLAGAGANAGAGDMGAARGAAGFGILILMIMGLATLLCMVATPVLGFVGSLLCLWGPQKSRGKPLIIVSFALDCAAFGLVLLGVIMSVASGASLAGMGSMREAAGVALVASLLSPLLMFAAWILFMLFLRAVALYFRDEG